MRMLVNILAGIALFGLGGIVGIKTFEKTMTDFTNDQKHRMKRDEQEVDADE